MLFDKVLSQTFSTGITASADYSAEVIFFFLAFGIPNNRLYADILQFVMLRVPLLPDFLWIIDYVKLVIVNRFTWGLN